LQGYLTPEGILQAWDFLIGETFKAEETVVAQPGAALVVRCRSPSSILS
jgi:hypothetical protein